jgi:hypothetical protein
MPPVVFQPTILVSERPKTHALDRTVTGTFLLASNRTSVLLIMVICFRPINYNTQHTVCRRLQQTGGATPTSLVNTEEPHTISHDNRDGQPKDLEVLDDQLDPRHYSQKAYQFPGDRPLHPTLCVTTRNQWFDHLITCAIWNWHMSHKPTYICCITVSTYF